MMMSKSNWLLLLSSQSQNHHLNQNWLKMMTHQKPLPNQHLIYFHLELLLQGKGKLASGFKIGSDLDTDTEVDVGIFGSIQSMNGSFEIYFIL
ncbi:hypothetical protein Btru_067568 [Bulinus truncatus]|nr:hypothetical protein Btru_067568 [Bulinus truncatus]